MQGILARGEHRLAVVAQPNEAWAFLRRNPGVDLLITALNLDHGASGMDLIRKVRADCHLRRLPVVIYTGHGDRDSVHQALELRVQNFLAKPYDDEAVFAEIEKAGAHPWREVFFEDEKAAGCGTGATFTPLREQLETLHRNLALATEPLRHCPDRADARHATEMLCPLRRQAAEAGARVVTDALARLARLADEARWSAWPDALESLEYAILLLANRLDPERGASPGFDGGLDAQAVEEGRARTAWLAAPAEGRCPVVSWEQLCRSIDALPGCPIIDSAAAAFQMAANGHPSCINPLMDLVARDPGLTVQMLVAANAAHPPGDDGVRIEDARLAVGQLGELRLEQQARSLVIVPERAFHLPPSFSWTRYWIFQRGVARIAQAICHDLEFYSLESAARVAGQLHDIGRLLLAHLHPAGFQAIIEYARLNHLRLHEVEKLFLGCTGNHLGARFAERAGLSRRFVNVMRGIDDPASINEDIQLAAIVSLARKLCRQNGVGASGDPVLDNAKPIQDTAQWRVLSEGLYPSFNLKKFQAQIHAHCDRLRHEFSGRQSGSVAELIAQSVHRRET